MRILVVIPHYCGAVDGVASGDAYSSQMSVMPRAVALNEMLVALKRNFGPNRFTGPQTWLNKNIGQDRTLDVVIVTMAGRNVLDRIEIDSSEYQVEYFDGDPLMLSFETQRIARERLGGYDVYAMLEDDMIIHDPAFIDKIVWFVGQFGPDAVLQPHRIEVSRAGRIGKSLIEQVERHPHPEFLHPKAAEILTGCYTGRLQTFYKTSSFISGGWFVTADQFAAWSRQPYFYDRKSNWIGPLESSASRALAIAHTVYQSGAPDPFFLEIGHYGVRFASRYAPEGFVFRGEPFTRPADPAVQTLPECSQQVDALLEEAMMLRTENRQLTNLLSSRSRLARRLFKNLTTKWP